MRRNDVRQQQYGQCFLKRGRGSFTEEASEEWLWLGKGPGGGEREALEGNGQHDLGCPDCN